MKRVAMPPKESFTIAKNADAQEVSNAETKVDDWYKQFQAAKKAKVEGALAAQHTDLGQLRLYLRTRRRRQLGR